MSRRTNVAVIGAGALGAQSDGDDLDRLVRPFDLPGGLERVRAARVREVGDDHHPGDPLRAHLLGLVGLENRRAQLGLESLGLGVLTLLVRLGIGERRVEKVNLDVQVRARASWPFPRPA